MKALFLLLAIIGLGCVRTEKPPPQGCQNDSDCVLVDASCCGCNEGGSRVASLVSQVRQQKRKCDSVACIQVISTDPSCEKGKRAVCFKSKCMIQ